MSFQKFNQHRLIRRLDGTIAPPLLSDSTAEDYALSIVRERERIKEERRQQQRENKTRENEGIRERVQDEITSRVQENITDRLPKWSNPLLTILEWTTENENRVQSLFLGLPDDPDPQVEWDNLPEQADPAYELPAFAPPRSALFDFLTSTPSQEIELDGDKTYFALWKYTGHVVVAEFRLNTPGSSQNVFTSAAYNTLMATDPTGFGWLVTSPQTQWETNSWINTMPPGLTFNSITGTANRGIPDNSGNAFFSRVYGGQFMGNGHQFTPDEIAIATVHVSREGSGFTRYYPVARITGRYIANANGRSGSGQHITVFAPCEMIMAVKISGRQTLAIPEMIGTTRAFYLHNTPSANFVRMNLNVNRFFRGLTYDPFEFDSFPVWFASTFTSPVRQYFPYTDTRTPWTIYPEPYLHEIESGIKYPRPRLLPPPPPPRCDPMSKCCCKPGGSNPDADRALLNQVLARLAQIDKKLGDPQTIPLWDIDVTKAGSNSVNRKPESIYKHLALVNERIEFVLKALGIDLFPIEVEKSASIFDNFSKMLKNTGVKLLQQLGDQLEERTKQKVRITSLMAYLDWIADTVHEKIGAFEVEIDLTDLDLEKSGDQSQKLYFPDAATLQAAMFKYTVDIAVELQALKSMMGRSLIETISVKKMAAEIGYQVDATADYLGYSYKEDSVDMQVLATLGKSVKDLPEFLKESKLKVKRHTLGSDEIPLESKLIQLLEAAAIIRAVHTVPMGSNEDEYKDIINSLLDATLNSSGNSDQSYKDWLKQINEFAQSQPAPMKVNDESEDL